MEQSGLFIVKWQNLIKKPFTVDLFESGSRESPRSWLICFFRLFKCFSSFSFNATCLLKSGHLSCKVFNILDLVIAPLWCYLTCFSIPLNSYKLAVRSGGLFRFRMIMMIKMIWPKHHKGVATYLLCHFIGAI